MPTKLFALNDTRLHLVLSANLQEISRLEFRQTGPCVVIATGSVQAASNEFNISIRIRLDVHGVFTSNCGAAETSFIAPAPPIFANRESFALLAAADIPHEGGAGSAGAPVPPPPRAILSARLESAGDGGFGVTDVRIAVIPFDEIVATTLA